MWVCFDHALKANLSFGEMSLVHMLFAELFVFVLACASCFFNLIYLSGEKYLAQLLFTKLFGLFIGMYQLLFQRNQYPENWTLSRLSIELLYQCWKQFLRRLSNTVWQFLERSSHGYWISSFVRKYKVFSIKGSAFSEYYWRENVTEGIRTSIFQLFLWAYASSNWNENNLV